MKKFPTHLGKAVPTEATDRHEVNILYLITPISEVVTETSKSTGLQSFYYRRGQVFVKVVGCSHFSIAMIGFVKGDNAMKQTVMMTGGNGESQISIETV